MAARRNQRESDEDEQSAGGSLARLGSAEMRRWATIPLMLILFCFGVWFLWTRHGETVLSHDSYQLDPRKINYTEPPEWLQADILAEVIQLGSLEEINLHQHDVTVQVVNAFELHPWVKRAGPAHKKYPASMTVEVTYRSPVGMVVLPHHPQDEAAFIQPIDEESVVLRGADITPEMARGYPRIDVGIPATNGPIGAEWGDPIVGDAAKLAKLVYDHWDALQDIVYQIQLSSQPTSTAATPDFDLVGKHATGQPSPLVIHWGRAPGRELQGEPTANIKLEKLREWLERERFDNRPIAGEIDLRSIRALTARRAGRLVR